MEEEVPATIYIPAPVNVASSGNEELEDLQVPIEDLGFHRVSIVESIDESIEPEQKESHVCIFPDCKKGITALPGMIDAIAENVVSKGRPFMGICVGMQLMSAIGHEYETTSGFGWLPGEVVKIKTELKLFFSLLFIFR